MSFTLVGVVCQFVLAVAPGARAGLVRVPDDQATITAGIAAAAPGDTVLVAHGTFQENIDFLGKGIVVASHFILDGDTDHVGATIIDGSNPLHADTTSCVRFHGGEDSTSVLQGFTITGGKGTKWVDPGNPGYVWRGGGGIFIFQASPTIRDNYIVGNEARGQGDTDGAQGGGILCFAGVPRILNNTITENWAKYGCGVAVDYSGGTFKNNIISRNSGGNAYGGGAGFWTIFSGPGPIVIENNTIVHNESLTTAGGLYIWGSTVTLRNNVVWGNTQASGSPIRLNGGTAYVTYCDVEGGYVGTGNIDADPVFLSAMSYLLSPGSPCADAGDPDPTYDDPEDPGNPGYALPPALGLTRCDMGCFGGPGCAPLHSPLATGVREQRPPVSGEGCLMGFPNPFRRATTIRFELPLASRTDLRVYDAGGRLVRTLVHDRLREGHHAAAWDGRDEKGRPAAAGVYFVRLRSERVSQWVKVMLVK
jgi:hypothetical protein